MPTPGRDAIVSLWNRMTEGFSFVVQLPSFGVVEFDDDGATGRWYVAEYAQGGAGPLFTLGVYHDRYLDDANAGGEGDAWRFARRRFDVLYMGPPDLSAAPIPFPSNP